MHNMCDRSSHSAAAGLNNKRRERGSIVSEREIFFIVVIIMCPAGARRRGRHALPGSRNDFFIPGGPYNRIPPWRDGGLRLN